MVILSIPSTRRTAAETENNMTKNNEATVTKTAELDPKIAKAIAAAIKEVSNDEGKMTKKADYPIKAVGTIAAWPPPGFDFNVFKPLKKNAFSSDIAFMEFKQAKAAYDLGKFAEKVEEAKALGGIITTRAKARVKRIPRLVDRLVECIVDLKKDGVAADKIQDMIRKTDIYKIIDAMGVEVITK